MPVHNALPYLDEAVESILCQTFSDFEFVILDDASTDGSGERLQEWARRDSRIQLLQVDENLGPALSSDYVARAARAPLVARMDADDISSPTRLLEQIQILRAHPEVGVVASVFEVIDPQGQTIRGPETWRLSGNADAASFAHDSIMYRHEIFLRVGGYRSECAFWEDKDLLIRMARTSRVMIIPRTLLRVRQNARSTRIRSDQVRIENAFDLMFRSLERLTKGQPYDDLLRQKENRDRKIHPKAVIAAGWVALWAGNRPRLVERLLKRARLRADWDTLAALSWALWAQASPSTLRKFLLLMRTIRDRWAKAAFREEAPVVWSPRWQRT